MTRYVPTASEQGAIDKLRMAGYVVVRARTYDAMLERKRIAEALQQAAEDHRASSERWALNCLNEERRLVHRLNAVCAAATSLGVPLDAINAALGDGDSKHTDEQNAIAKAVNWQ